MERLLRALNSDRCPASLAALVITVLTLAGVFIFGFAWQCILHTVR